MLDEEKKNATEKDNKLDALWVKVAKQLLELLKARKEYGDVDELIKNEITLIDQALPIIKQCIEEKDTINQEAFFTLIQEQKNFKAKVFKELGHVTSMYLYNTTLATQTLLKRNKNTTGENNILSKFLAKKKENDPESKTKDQSQDKKKILDNDDLFFEMVFGDNDGEKDSDDEDVEQPKDKEMFDLTSENNTGDMNDYGVLLILTHSNGRLEIYTLPKQHLIFHVDGFANGKQILTNGLTDDFEEKMVEKQE
eukprot:UN32741